MGYFVWQSFWQVTYFLFRKNGIKNFFKLFNYPFIVVADPEAKFKDR
jgi:hypothetical protein